MLAALIQALKGVRRLVLIGDPRQLPPIGAGRPFVDIVKQLTPEGVTETFPRVGPGYAELTVRRRQAGEDREDLRLAEWFSGSSIAAGEDDVFDSVVDAGQSAHVRFVKWETADELRSHLLDVLVSELRLPDDQQLCRGPMMLPASTLRSEVLHGTTSGSSILGEATKLVPQRRPRVGRSCRLCGRQPMVYPI